MRHNLTALLLLLALLGATFAVAQDAATDDGATPKASVAEDVAAEADEDAPAKIDPEEVARLVVQLGSKIYTEREAAEKRLTAMPKDVAGHLDPLLAKASDPEVLARLERIYKAHVPTGALCKEGEELEPGFLGIQYKVVSVDQDDRLTGRQWGVLVDEVVANTAAEEAGLKAGDLIVKVDGEEFVGDIVTVHFGRRVQIAGAGGKIDLALYRQKGEDRPQSRRRDVVRLPGGPLRRRDVVQIAPDGEDVKLDPELADSVSDISALKKVTVTLRARTTEKEGTVRVVRGGVSHVTPEELLAYRWTQYWRKHQAEVKVTYAPPKPVDENVTKPGKTEEPTSNSADEMPAPAPKPEEKS